MLVAVSYYSSLIPIVFFLIFIKANQQRRLWVIFLYLFVSLASDTINFSMRRAGDTSSPAEFYTATAFTFLELTMFTYFFYEVLVMRSSKRLLVTLYILSTFIGVSTVLFAQYGKFNGAYAAAEEISIIALCVTFFYEQMNNLEVTFIYASKDFWIIVAFLFYSASTLFLFIFTAVLTSELTNRFWEISQVANVTKNLLFTVAFIRRLPLRTA